MEHSCEDCDFIKRDLVPEMVHNRCFCESGSREFVELDSVTVEHLDDGTASYYKKRISFPHLSTCARTYRVTAGILFSGERSDFPLIVKLHTRNSPPFDGFQNEEMFYTKMTRHFGTDGAPNCYLSDMGRYGRPVIVLEDLTARGYFRVDTGELDKEHLKLCAKALATFHGRGMKLRASQRSTFKEYCVNLWHADESNAPLKKLHREQKTFIENACKSSRCPESAVTEKTLKKLREMDNRPDELNDVSTICHGRFLGDNVLFGYENGKPSDAKIMDWEQMELSTPALDFGTVLMANLPDEAEPMVEIFCRDILRFYMDAVRNEYPEVNCDLLERDILAGLLSGFSNSCCLTGRDYYGGAAGVLKILRVLDSLGSLD